MTGIVKPPKVVASQRGRCQYSPSHASFFRWMKLIEKGTGAAHNKAAPTTHAPFDVRSFLVRNKFADFSAAGLKFKNSLRVCSGFLKLRPLPPAKALTCHFSKVSILGMKSARADVAASVRRKEKIRHVKN